QGLGETQRQKQIPVLTRTCDSPAGLGIAIDGRHGGIFWCEARADARSCQRKRQSMLPGNRSLTVAALQIGFNFGNDQAVRTAREAISSQAVVLHYFDSQRRPRACARSKSDGISLVVRVGS